MNGYHDFHFYIEFQLTKVTTVDPQISVINSGLK